MPRGCLKMKRLYFLLLIVPSALFFAYFILWGPMVSGVEQPEYAVERDEDNIQIRLYSPVIAAEVSVTGERQAAISQGFRLLADYIFGNNISSQKIAMTAPVQQQSSEKIAMTAPVLQQSDSEGWLVRFIMPSTYTMQTLPKPLNPRVRIREIPAERFAAIRFSGKITDDNILTHEKLLGDYVRTNLLVAGGSAVYAFYNPPWTLPFMRRNEILIRLAD
jgi:hypothetical protein